MPKQHSSGGKDKLGSISKPGNRYLRSLFTAGALAVIRYAGSMAQSIGLAYGIAGAEADQGRRHRPRQQDRQNGLGHDGQGRTLQGTRRACGGTRSRRTSGVMRRLGGRTARNAEPVDPAIGTTHMCQCIVECGLLTGTDPRRALWPAVMRTALTGRTHGCTDQQRSVKF